MIDPGIKEYHIGIFNEIIRKRIADYIENEVKDLIKAKSEEIVTDVLSCLQSDVELFKEITRKEAELVVRAFYNGKEVPQKEGKPNDNR